VTPDSASHRASWQHDELPKLVEVCRHYMQYESDTLERVMRARKGIDLARSTGNVKSLGLAGRELRTGLSGLYAVVERYPNLTANQAFPEVLVARPGDFPPAGLLHFQNDEKVGVDMKALFAR
jgi:LemA protein